MRTSLLVAVLALTFGGCASFEEAYGRPDPFEWTYFRGEPGDVVSAIDQALNLSNIRVESVRNEAGGALMTLSSRAGSADFDQILVQSSDAEDFASRAQIYPQRDPLPRWLEMEVSGRM